MCSQYMCKTHISTQVIHLKHQSPLWWAYSSFSMLWINIFGWILEVFSLAYQSYYYIKFLYVALECLLHLLCDLYKKMQCCHLFNKLCISSLSMIFNGVAFTQEDSYYFLSVFDDTPDPDNQSFWFKLCVKFLFILFVLFILYIIFGSYDYLFLILALISSIKSHIPAFPHTCLLLNILDLTLSCLALYQIIWANFQLKLKTKLCINQIVYVLVIT